MCVLVCLRSACPNAEATKSLVLDTRLCIQHVYDNTRSTPDPQIMPGRLCLQICQIWLHRYSSVDYYSTMSAVAVHLYVRLYMQALTRDNVEAKLTSRNASKNCYCDDQSKGRLHVCCPSVWLCTESCAIRGCLSRLIQYGIVRCCSPTGCSSLQAGQGLCLANNLSVQTQQSHYIRHCLHQHPLQSHFPGSSQSLTSGCSGHACAAQPPLGPAACAWHLPPAPLLILRPLGLVQAQLLRLAPWALPQTRDACAACCGVLSQSPRACGTCAASCAPCACQMTPAVHKAAQVSVWEVKLSLNSPSAACFLL